MRQTQRQTAKAHRSGRRQQLSPHRETALTVEHLADREIALGRGHHIGMPGDRHPCGLAAQRHARHTETHLESDQVPALVEREIAPAGVGVGVVFLETVADVLGLAFDRDPHAHPDVVGNAAPVGFERRDHLDHALALEHPALGDRSGDEGNVLDTGRRVAQAVGRHRQPGGVADSGALDRGFRAIEKAVEHLGIEPPSHRLLGRQAVVTPDGLRGRFAEVGQPLVSAPGRDHREAAGARPVDQLADQRRLIAEGQRIHDTGLLGATGEQRATEGVGFDGHVDHMLAVREGLETVIDRGDRVTGALDDHIEGRMTHQRLPVLTDVRGASGQRGVDARGSAAFGRPAHPRKVRPGRVR